jgi:hypothetical protein
MDQPLVYFVIQEQLADGSWVSHDGAYPGKYWTLESVVTRATAQAALPTEYGMPANTMQVVTLTQSAVTKIEVPDAPNSDHTG